MLMNLKREKKKGRKKKGDGMKEGWNEGRKEGGEGGRRWREGGRRKEGKTPRSVICSLDGMYLIVFSKISPRYE